MYTKSLFIFRRDLRAIDNTALNAALTNSKQVIVIFIFDPNQISEKNSYRSANAINAMIDSIEELAIVIPLHCFYGDPSKIIDKLITTLSIDAIYYNADYTPYSKTRDTLINTVVASHNKQLHVYHDILLLDKPMGKPDDKESYYKVFTPFYNKYRKTKIRAPNTTPPKLSLFYSKHIANSVNPSQYRMKTKSSADTGGRSKALIILSNIKKQNKYDKYRDTLTYTTTRLSLHNKFGTVSIREVYKAFTKLSKQSREALIRQLFWRDFYTNMAINDKNFLRRAFDPRFDNVAWKSKHHMAWTTGNTGIPIIDACMRELNATGFMHNRGRLIVSSFYTKNLLLPWRHGEKYFAQMLTDYDPIQNNYNWQFSMGSLPGSASAWFRIMSPEAQSKKHDPDAKYIKKWIPELEKIPADHLHEWETHYNKYNVKYPKPIVNTSETRKYALIKYKSALK